MGCQPSGCNHAENPPDDRNHRCTAFVLIPASDPEISNEQILAEINSQIRETPKWLRDLTRILGYVFAVGIILGIVIAIIHSIRRFGKDFAVEEEDEVVFLESERDAELADNAGMQALHDAYEKARYSENGCTREDMNAL